MTSLPHKYFSSPPPRREESNWGWATSPTLPTACAWLRHPRAEKSLTDPGYRRHEVNLGDFFFERIRYSKHGSSCFLNADPIEPRRGFVLSLCTSFLGACNKKPAGIGAKWNASVERRTRRRKLSGRGKAHVSQIQILITPKETEKRRKEKRGRSTWPAWFSQQRLRTHTRRRKNGVDRSTVYVPLQPKKRRVSPSCGRLTDGRDRKGIESGAAVSVAMATRQGSPAARLASTQTRPAGEHLSAFPSPPPPPSVRYPPSTTLDRLSAGGPRRIRVRALLFLPTTTSQEALLKGNFQPVQRIS